jgi:hypothetical protein
MCIVTEMHLRRSGAVSRKGQAAFFKCKHFFSSTSNKLKHLLVSSSRERKTYSSETMFTGVLEMSVYAEYRPNTV